MKIIKQYIKNKNTRPEKQRKETRAIVLHWTATEGATAKNIRDYFQKSNSYASAHFTVDWTGSIIQIMPDNEVAWHCGSSLAAPQMNDGLPYCNYGRNVMQGYASPNYTTIGIEMCFDYGEKKFHKNTLDATAWLCTKLIKKYNLRDASRITTHYEIVGWKDCPQFFIDKEKDWENSIRYNKHFYDFIRKVKELE